MTISPLNSSLEVGVRVLMILTAAYPERLDLNRLVLLDHGVLHSADLGGPSSLHPPLPIRSGELGARRAMVEAGLHVMVRRALVEMRAGSSGIEFLASEDAYSFVSALASTYAVTLNQRVVWVLDRFPDLTEDVLRAEMRSIFSSWSEEFAQIDLGSEGWAT
ncbi:hypothetical protein GCM10029976_032330 [Kribbella albertanoniae]|uniref:Threonine transporter n=1 Tax=Kribbella albertanoniae TaxID=1266829 RepID=A0A4R4QIM4_9ACTN|nr:ABC-three component system middle component 2 [Kribbella albertanoniae]TDC35538.1 threonine transporter [Kribbella albertanoniae]